MLQLFERKQKLSHGCCTAQSIIQSIPNTHGNSSLETAIAYNGCEIINLSWNLKLFFVLFVKKVNFERVK